MSDKTARKLARELKRTRRAEAEQDRRERMHPAARTEPYDFRSDVENTQPIAAVHRFDSAIDDAVRVSDEAGASRLPNSYPLDGPGPYGERRT